MSLAAGRELASQDIPCGLCRVHPEHIYQGIGSGVVWYCDGTWPDPVADLRRALWAAVEPPLKWIADRLSRTLDRLDRRLPEVGYWLRPYDMLADRRRWRWQERHPCQTVDGLPAVLRRWDEDAKPHRCECACNRNWGGPCGPCVCGR